MRTVRYGMPVGGPLQAVGPLAKAIEDRGFDSVWTTETTSNPFIQAALVAEATSRVRIGTGIALGFPPSPGLTAMTAVDRGKGRAMPAPERTREGGSRTRGTV